MRHILLLVIVWCIGFAPQVNAADFIIWMEAQTPDDKTLNRAARLAGVKQHLFFRDLAFPPARVRCG